MELYKNPGNLFVAQFIGSPAMNILPGTINKAGKTTVVTMSAGERLTCRSRPRLTRRRARSVSACGRKI